MATGTFYYYTVSGADAGRECATDTEAAWLADELAQECVDEGLDYGLFGVTCECACIDTEERCD